MRQRGMVLATGLFLVVLLTVFLTGVGRQAAASLVLADLARDHDRTFQLAEDALADARRAPVFRRETSSRVTHPLPGAQVTTTIEYLGHTRTIPHPAWLPERDARLVAHHFRLRASAGRRGVHHTLERDVAVIAPDDIADTAALTTANTPDTAPFGGAVVPGPWRVIPP